MSCPPWICFRPKRMRFPRYLTFPRELTFIVMHPAHRRLSESRITSKKCFDVLAVTGFVTEHTRIDNLISTKQASNTQANQHKSMRIDSLSHQDMPDLSGLVCVPSSEETPHCGKDWTWKACCTKCRSSLARHGAIDFLSMCLKPASTMTLASEAAP